MDNTKASFKISLRINHPNIHPGQISRKLGLVPTTFWRAGEARKTPKGRPLEGSYESTYWNFEVPLLKKYPLLDEMLMQVIEQCIPNKIFLKEIISTGGRIHISISYFINEQGGEILDAALLKKLGDLGIGLMWFIYPPDSIKTK